MLRMGRDGWPVESRWSESLLRRTPAARSSEPPGRTASRCRVKRLMYYFRSDRIERSRVVLVVELGLYPIRGTHGIRDADLVELARIRAVTDPVLSEPEADDIRGGGRPVDRASHQDPVEIDTLEPAGRGIEDHGDVDPPVVVAGGAAPLVYQNGPLQGVVPRGITEERRPDRHRVELVMIGSHGRRDVISIDDLVLGVPVGRQDQLPERDGERSVLGKRYRRVVQVVIGIGIVITVWICNEGTVSQCKLVGPSADLARGA